VPAKLLRKSPRALAPRAAETAYHDVFLRNASAMCIVERSLLHFLAVNDSALLLYGYTRGELLARTLNDIDQAARAPLAARGRHLAHHVRKDGKLLALRLTATEIEWGGEVALLFQVDDPAASDELKADTAQSLHAVLESMNDAFYTCDRDFRLTYFNERTTVLLDRTREEMTGRTLPELFPGTIGSPVEAAFLKALASGKASEFTLYQTLRDRWIDLKVYPSSEGLAVYVRDASERMRAERALREKEARLKLVLSEVPAIMWHVDTDMRVQWVDGLAASRMRLSDRDVGRLLVDVVAQAPDGEVSLSAHRSALRGESRTFTLERRGLILEARVEPLLSPEGDIIGVVGAAIDVTVLRGANQALLESKRQLALVQEVAQLGSWRHEVQSGHIAWSQELFHIVGHSAGAGDRTVHPHFANFVHPAHAAEFAEAMTRCVASGARALLEHRIVRADGEIRWVRTTAEIRHNDGDGSQGTLIGAVLDISAQKLVEERLAFLAHYDSLTGFHNREGFSQALELVLKDRDFAANPVYVFFVDLDGFKSVNESLGHAFGDRVLREVAATLRNFKEIELFARLGSDEFVLATSSLEGDAAARELADRLTGAFTHSLHFEEREYFIGVSVGISAYPRDGDDVGTLLGGADTAMCEVKKTGGRGYSFFAADMRTRALKRLTIEHDLHLAIERKQFTLHYQPLVDVKTGTIVAAEALIRWIHPDAGMIPPDSFIPIAEETGQIIAIGSWVLREAIGRCKSWQQLAERPIRVCVNISAMQLIHPDFCDQVQDVLQDAGLQPGLLELEITETATLRDLDRAVDVLTTLRAMGVRCSIDDFGTGYSSLSYLKRLPADVLKIDRSFINELESNESDRTLVEAMIYVGHKLGLTVVGEGVETIEQYRLLDEIRCDEIQGYFISKPKPPGEFEALLVQPLTLSLYDLSVQG